MQPVLLSCVLLNEFSFISYKRKSFLWYVEEKKGNKENREKVKNDRVIEDANMNKIKSKKRGRHESEKNKKKIIL